MIKYSLKLAAFFVLLLSSVAQAGLIDIGGGVIVCDTYDDPDEVCIISDLIPDELIIIKDEYEWVWVSGVNSESYFPNTLMNPDFHGDQGWRYATTTKELAELATLELADFQDGNKLLHTALYWNTWLMSVNSDQLSKQQIASEWVEYSPSNILWSYDTFYVRDIASQVPEPSTIMIFAIALIALSLRKRAIK